MAKKNKQFFLLPTSQLRAPERFYHLRLNFILFIVIKSYLK